MIEDKKLIKLIVFDLGETLINYKGLPLDWSSHYEKSLKYVFEELSITYTDAMIYEASKILSKYNTRINPRVKEVSAKQIFSEIINAIQIDPDYYNKFVRVFFGYFQRESEPELTAIELLSYLKISKINCAVLTDVPYGMPKEFALGDLGKLFDYFDLIVTSGEVGYRKPSEVGLELILKYFQADTSNTVYVGNEQKDIELARKLEVYSVLMNRDKNIPAWGQRLTISKLIEMKPLLTKNYNW